MLFELVGQHSPTTVPILDGKIILLVDGDEKLRRLVATLLGLHGALVIDAESAQNAITLLDIGVPDILVSDLCMLTEDGNDLIRCVRARSLERGGAVPAIALTEEYTPESREAALAAGFQELLPRYLDANHLASTARHLVGPMP